MMKWWGWGDPQRSFPMADKPGLWPWIQGKLGIAGEGHPYTKRNPIDFSSVRIPAPSQEPAFLAFAAELRGFLANEQLTQDPKERLLRAYGKSFPDLFRVRRGEVRRAPDLVVLPESHDDVEKIVAAAVRHSVCLIPFGGGTNIVGGVNPDVADKRAMVSIDMARMNRLLFLDPQSRTAVIQAGALGPKLEADLGNVGHSLGHFPDSFEYSTLGGWLATRSAGMQSDAYGKIEDMVVSIKMVTPSGTIVTKPVPQSSAGPDLNRMLVGSEGILGIITEATMRVHRAPAVKDYRGYLFKSFANGVKAIEDILESEYVPSMIRLQDEGETELALNMKSPKKGFEALIQKPIKRWLKAKGFTTPCIMIVGFEGDAEKVKSVRDPALAIIRRHGGFSLGRSVGKTWSKDKFNVPYLRDYIMDYGCMADVAETATLWSKVVPLHMGVVETMRSHFAKDGGKGYVGCHISHTYRTGACLYFTFAARQPVGKELEHYYGLKRAITDTIMSLGGTVSHHHAIGTEHRPWMRQEVSPAGLQAIRAVKESLDPNGLLNPGKLLPDEDKSAAGARTLDSDADFDADTGFVNRPGQANGPPAPVWN